jgi:hypothetical protein
VTVLIGYALIALIVAAVLFYAAIALLPAGLSMKPESDRRPFELPVGRLLERGDLERVRIPVTLRGYRFAETDDLIDRLTAEIVVRDEEIERLKSLVGRSTSSEASLDSEADFATGGFLGGYSEGGHSEGGHSEGGYSDDRADRGVEIDADVEGESD